MGTHRLSGVTLAVLGLALPMGQPVGRSGDLKRRCG